MITSLTEMLELPNVGNINTSTIKFESRDKVIKYKLQITNYKL